MDNKNEIQVVKLAVAILAVTCTALPDKIIDILTGYLWDEEEAGDIKNAFEPNRKEAP